MSVVSSELKSTSSCLKTIQNSNSWAKTPTSDDISQHTQILLAVKISHVKLQNC